MKKTIALTLLIILCGLASAAPTIYTVAVAPLYPNTESTLTCIYLDNETGETATYRWYDSKDGVWYNGESTYSNIEYGYSYKCSVNLTKSGSSTGWYNSTNNVTVTSSCINPCPYYYLNKYATMDITNLGNMTPIYIFGDYGTTTDHKIIVENNSIIFLCTDYNTTGSIYERTSWKKYFNIMYGEIATGDFTLYNDSTDENYGTYTYASTTASSPPKYSEYVLDDVVPAGTNMYVRIALWTSDAADAALFWFEGYNTGGWDTLYYQSSRYTSHYIYYTYLTTTEAYTKFRVKLDKEYGGSDLAELRVYEIEVLNWTSGTIDGTVITPSSFTVNNFTSDGGYIYDTNYINEATAANFSFTTAGTLNQSEINVFCSLGSTPINNTGDAAGTTYLIGTTSDHRYLQTKLTYDETSTYYRRWTPICSSDKYIDEKIFMLDAATTTTRAYTFTINDQSSSGKYRNGWMKIKRNVGAYGISTIISEEWGADNQILAYLSDNEEYTLTLVADDCSERNIGYVTANPSDTSYTITVSEDSDYDLTPVGDIFHHLYYRVRWVNSSNRINITFYDEENETEWFWWGVYYANNDTLAYSDNTTSHDYHGSYLANNSRKYYVVIQFDHPSGSLIRVIEGTIRWYNNYLDAIMWEGEIAGLHAETFYLLLALLIIAMTALIGTPTSLGFTMGLVFFEVVVFSILQWLPFLSSANENGVLLIFLFAIFGLAIAYVYRGGKI